MPTHESLAISCATFFAVCESVTNRTICEIQHHFQLTHLRIMNTFETEQNIYRENHSININKKPIRVEFYESNQATWYHVLAYFIRATFFKRTTRRRLHYTLHVLNTFCENHKISCEPLDF